MGNNTAYAKASPLRRHPLAAYFALAYTITWVLLAPIVVAGTGLANPLFVLLYLAGSFGPGLAAVLVSWATGGWGEVRALLGRLFQWRVRSRWYVTVLLLPVALRLGAVGVQMALGAPPPAFEGAVWPLALAQFLVLALVTGPLGEEVGWRGFALPRLQRHHGALAASLILGVLWALWHLPTFLLGGTAQAAVSPVWLLVEIVGATVLYTWVYNNTGGSLLLAFLFHDALNTAGNVILPGVMAASYTAGYARASAGLTWVAAAIVVIAFGPTRLRRPAKRGVEE